MTWANWLTISRILAIPIVLLFWKWESYVLALSILGIALLTDFFDGKVARLLGQESRLGALLDPVADKLVILAFVSFLYLKSALPFWFAGIVLLRNIAQLSAIPILGWWLAIPFKVKPAFPPKLATALSFVIVFFSLAMLVPTSLQGASNHLFRLVLLSILVASCALELYILATYLPRFYQISMGLHDTFE